MFDFIRLEGYCIFLLFLLFILAILIFLLTILLIFIIFVLIFIYLFHSILFVLLIIINSPPPSSLGFYPLFNFISNHHIILLFNTLQPRISILVSSLENKISLLVNITHILLFSHVEWLDHVAKIFDLRFNIFFFIHVAIYIQSFL